MIFSQRLKHLRLQNNFTQQEMSDLLYIDQSTYSRYENGISHATAEFILQVAEVFNVSTDWLLKEDTNKQI